MLKMFTPLLLYNFQKLRCSAVDIQYTHLTHLFEFFPEIEKYAHQICKRGKRAQSVLLYVIYQSISYS